MGMMGELMLSAPSSRPPPSVLPDISPARGEIVLSSTLSPIGDVAEESIIGWAEKVPRSAPADLPPCGGDVRQDRGGCEGTPTLAKSNLPTTPRPGS